MSSTLLRRPIGALLCALLLGAALLASPAPTAQAATLTSVTVKNRCSSTLNVNYTHYQLGKIKVGIRARGEVTYQVKPHTTLSTWRPGTKALGHPIGTTKRTITVC